MCRVAAPNARRSPSAARDVASRVQADGLYFCSRGEVRTDNSNNNVIEAHATDGLEDVIVRRGFRGDLYVATFKFKWNNDSCPGWLVRWLSPGDYHAIAIDPADAPRSHRVRPSYSQDAIDICLFWC